MNDALHVYYALMIIAALIGAYWLPSIVAWERKVPNLWSIVVINGLLGWTLIGWVVCLAMAVRDKPTLKAVT